jgi:homoserine dehydrogenase
MNETIRIGLFGIGVVGRGVIEQLRENAELISRRVGKRVEVVTAVVANPQKDRGIDLSGITISDDPDSILKDESIDIVVELIGGLDAAEAIILSALAAGKPVVTANKALLAVRAQTIFNAAYTQNTPIGFECSVGGGIPIIRTLREGFAGDGVLKIAGIMNGTANYILSRMSDEGCDFDTALKAAQELGYAEADPTFDIEGIDTAHKLTLLMNIAYNGIFDFDQLYVEGITAITAADVEYARALGYTIKLLGIAKAGDMGIEGHVYPALVPNASMLAMVGGATNAITLEGNYAGPSFSVGLGAGSHPSASAVVADIIEACRYQISEQQVIIPPLSAVNGRLQPVTIAPMNDSVARYYLRLTVLAQESALTTIVDMLTANEVNIHSIQTMRSKGEETTIIILTDEAREVNIQSALLLIDGFDFIAEETQLIRIYK